MNRSALACLSLCTSLLVAGPALAQVTTTRDDSIAILPSAPPPDLSLGTGSGFGGQLGESGGGAVVVAWDSDVLGNVTIHVRGASCTGSDDRIVFYVDSQDGGFADTTAFTDTFSLDAAAVSATPIGATLRFAPPDLMTEGFLADYAIALRNESGFAGAFFYALEAGGGHVATALTVTRAGIADCSALTISGLTLAMMRVPQGRDLRWLATLLNASNGFRSNEFHGVRYAGPNIGQNEFAMDFLDYNVFTSIGQLVINEVDADTPGNPDLAEFIELLGPPNARLDGVALVTFNGADDLAYPLPPFTTGIDLDGRTLGGDGFFVLGNAAVSPDLTFNDSQLQQGADAVALYLGEGAAFPNDAPIVDAGLIDALVYDSGQPDDPGLLAGLTPGQAQLNEDPLGTALDSTEASNQRCPDGAGGPLVISGYRQSPPSPGASNTCELCGNGILETNIGELCDDGAANGTGTSCCLTACTFRAENQSCGASTGAACDLANTCNATGVCVDRVRPADFQCRAQVGVCDVAELCDGVSQACPADGVAGTSVECRASADDCDVAETCDGVNKTCPLNEFADADVVCRDAAGDCDVAETCTGGGAACPTDLLLDASTVCRGAAGLCDVAETCAGAVDCPTDVVADASVICRPADGACDVAESCAGGVDCPTDVFAGASVTCRPAADAICDVAEVCDTTGPDCPADVTTADGTPCADSLVCNGDEECGGGLCGDATDVACDDSDACTADACAEPDGCASTPIAGCCNASDECDDGDLCTTDVCSGAGGTCANSPITGCCEADDECEDGNVCTTNACNLDTNRCEATAVSGCCEADGDCGDGDVCTTDTCDTSTGECSNADITGCCLTDGDCDDGDACTLDDCSAANACTHDSITGCCTVDLDCDDGDACTTDSCADDACVFTPISGCVSADAGVPVDDAGVPVDDGGPTEEDAGGAADDAGTVRVDSGTARLDAGTPGVDAGTGEVEGGCNCRAGGSSSSGGGAGLFGLALVATLARRRKRS